MGLFTKKHRESTFGSALGQPHTAAAASTSARGHQEPEQSKLHRAAASGHLAWLRQWRWWIKVWGVDRRDSENRTPLHLACANGHTAVVNFLLGLHCELNPVDNFMKTPLMRVSEL
ncbi:ankyrin repeat domain-containing protein 7-like [Calypte anna]|uniref:ankyrin repeat domain-containing protein 7-like n=1 Tax=Calypte anna TaxID=9244 RepID=UPI0011C45962|nr:ankyrin repeat domain-containing protein 7-like [Calypte anna]